MRVGTRHRDNAVLICSRDHPHACGDKKRNSAIVYQLLGSSPCVWGQGKALKRTPANSRIIPMRVGTSDTYSSDTPQGRDHPHACGDKQYQHQKLRHYSGSSPCVWGQVSLMCFKNSFARIIPMRVGTR